MYLQSVECSGQIDVPMSPHVVQQHVFSTSDHSHTWMWGMQTVTGQMRFIGGLVTLTFHLWVSGTRLQSHDCRTRVIMSQGVCWSRWCYDHVKGNTSSFTHLSSVYKYVNHYWCQYICWCCLWTLNAKIMTRDRNCRIQTPFIHLKDKTGIIGFVIVYVYYIVKTLKLQTLMLISNLLPRSDFLEWLVHRIF